MAGVDEIMATSRRILTAEILREDLQSRVFRVGTRDLVGVEVELTPLATIGGRLDLKSGLAGALRLVERATDKSWRDLSEGGTISREPGGQVEYSGPAMETPEAAGLDAVRVLRRCRMRARQMGFDLAAVGFHPWASADAIGLQMQAPRYQAMQDYFDAIGPAGRRMMRQTGSIQINVDFGELDSWVERWELAQRLGPVLGAMFANSAVEEGRAAEVVGLRGQTWLKADPSRTGIPSFFLEEPDSSPIDQYLRFALDAGVMWKTRGTGAYEVAKDGVTFAQWAEEGDEWGYPDVQDWWTHLGTLFPDVRPKGYLEIRTMDAPGEAWVGFATLIVGHALRNQNVRRALLSELRTRHGELDCWRQQAGESGLADLRLRGAAERLLELVRPQLDRRGAWWLDAFADRYVRVGRSPGDELRLRASADGRIGTEAFWDLEAERWSDVERGSHVTVTGRD